MITEPCLEHLNLKLEGAHEQMESYEHLGEIKTVNIDMHRRYEELNEARHVFLTEKDSDIQCTVDFPTPPPVTWEWLHDGAVFWTGGSSGSVAQGAFSGWLSGEPNNLDGQSFGADCAVLTSDGWRDRDCAAARPFLCE